MQSKLYQFRGAVQILTTKSWLGLEKNRTVRIDSISSVVGKPSYEALAQEISDASVTLLRNEKSLLPLSSGSHVHLVTVTDQYDPQLGLELQFTLQAHGLPVELSHLSNESGHERVEEVVSLAQKSDVVVMGVYLSVGAWKGSLRFSRALEQFLAPLTSLSKPVITVTFGDPYVLAKLPTTDVVLAPYNGTVLAERSIGKALVGAIQIKGKLPVTIPGKYRLDSGLEVRPRSQQSK